MTKKLLLSTAIFVACSVSGIAQTKNIVVKESTYQKLTTPGVNHVRMAKKADKRKGLIRVIDAPHERFMFEKLMTQDPATGEMPENFRQRELQFLSDNKNQFVSRTKSQNIDWKQTGPYNVGGRTRALAIDITNDKIILAGGISGGMWRSIDGGETWKKTTSQNQHQSVTAVAQDPRDGHTNTWYYSTGEYLGNSASASGASYFGVGVFKSTNNGETWSKIQSTDNEVNPFFTETLDAIWNVCVDPQNGDVYIATYGEIWRLTGKEHNAEVVLNSNPTSGGYANMTDVICTPSGIKYATFNSNGEVHGFFRSKTGNPGDWTEISPSDIPLTYNRTVLAYAPSNENILYFLSETPESGLNGHSFWKLTINGSTLEWENRSQNLPNKGIGDRDVSGYRSQGSYNMIIKVAPDDENMLFIGGTNLFRSDDAFASNANPISKGDLKDDKTKTYWVGGYATANNVTQYDNHHPDQHSLAFFKDGKTLLSGHDGGISKTIDYKQIEDSNPADNGTGDYIDLKPIDWVSLNNGYLTTQAYTVGIDNKDETSFEILTGLQDNGTWYTYTDATTKIHKKNWYDVGSGDGAYCSNHNSINSFIISSQGGRIVLNEIKNDRNQWTRIDPAGVNAKVLFINPYEIDANNERIMYYAGGTDLWRNNDILEIDKFQNGAATEGWTKMANTNISGKISAIKSSTLPANLVYFGTSEGKIYRIMNANSDQAIVSEITGSSMPEGYISSIEVNPANGSYVYATFSNYEIESIFFSKDAGKTWTAVSGNLEITEGSRNVGPSVRYINVINAENGPIYFAGTSIGLYMTTELSSNTKWTLASEDKIGSTIVSMIKTRKDGFIVVGTHGNGIFHTKITPGEPIVDPLGPLVGIEDIKNDDTKLSIYPNPMVDGSRISFPNKNNSSYRLVVIDASGRVVRIIENVTNNNILINKEQLKPGIHLINLEGEKIYKGKLLVK